MRGKPIRETVETLTRLYLRGALLGVIVAALLAPSTALAAPLDARVIWSHGDRVYLAAGDSFWIAMGSNLRFFEKKKEIASAIVLSIEDSTLAVARITSGSLAHVKHLDRLSVDAERARTKLRVGIPSSKRVQPFFGCYPRLSRGPFGADFFEGGSKGFSPRGKNLPDSLFIREYDDAADEEIALELRQIDVAIFWPGEASTHIREAMRWTGTPTLIRSQGVIGVRAKEFGRSNEIDPGRLPTRTEEQLARFNMDLFRGDLVPIQYAKDDSMPAWSLEVDPTLPDYEHILLALGPSTHETKPLLLTYFDEPVQPEPIPSDVVNKPKMWLFRIGCPVLSRPELRTYLGVIDLSEIVNGFACDKTKRSQ